MEIVSWKESLSKAKKDEKVGISIAPLVGDDYFSFFITEIAPKGKVGAHYHNKGQEIYLIQQGSGLILTAPSDHPERIERSSVASGDIFSVPEGYIHQLVNTSDSEPLVLQFGCPTSHLSDDRVITESLYTE